MSGSEAQHNNYSVVPVIDFEIYNNKSIAHALALKLCILHKMIHIATI